MSQLFEVSGHRCLVVGDDAAPVRSAQDATDLVGEALGEGASLIAVPVARLDPSFFDLRSGLAGEILQKAANYRLKFAVIGTVSDHIAASKAFHDLVVESEHSTTFFFEPDLEALQRRLADIPA